MPLYSGLQKSSRSKRSFYFCGPLCYNCTVISTVSYVVDLTSFHLNQNSQLANIKGKYNSFFFKRDVHLERKVFFDRIVVVKDSYKHKIILHELARILQKQNIAGSRKMSVSF